MHLPLLPLAAILLLCGGCARDAAGGDYPSLARRPVEELGFAEPELPAAAPLVADVALDTALARLRDGLVGVASGFDRDAVSAERAGAAARGRPVGSEPWLLAQSALAELDDWRAQASALASEADALAASRAGALQQVYPALTTVRDAIGAELERQDAAIARLQALTPTA